MAEAVAIKTTPKGPAVSYSEPIAEQREALVEDVLAYARPRPTDTGTQTPRPLEGQQAVDMALASGTALQG